MPTELERLIAPTQKGRAKLQLVKRGAWGAFLLAFLALTLLFKFDFRFLSGYHTVEIPEQDIPCTLQSSRKSFAEWSADFDGHGQGSFQPPTGSSDFVRAIYVSNLSRTETMETKSGLQIAVDGPSFVVCASGRVKAATALLARGRFQQALLAH